MNRLLFVALYVLGLVGLTTLFVSCASQAQFDAAHALSDAVVKATDQAGPGGATITPEEQATLDKLFLDLKGAPGINWQQLAASVGTTIAAGIPALRYGLPYLLARIPNAQIIGQEEAHALDKAAGIPAPGQASPAS